MIESVFCSSFQKANAIQNTKPIHCSTNTSFWISNKCAASQRCYHMIVDPHVAAARFQVKAQIYFPTWYIQVPFSCILLLLWSHYAIRYLIMIIPLVAPAWNLALSWRLDSKCNCPLLALKSYKSRSFKKYFDRGCIWVVERINITFVPNCIYTGLQDRSNDKKAEGR